VLDTASHPEGVPPALELDRDRSPSTRQRGRMITRAVTGGTDLSRPAKWIPLARRSARSAKHGDMRVGEPLLYRTLHQRLIYADDIALLLSHSAEATMKRRANSHPNPPDPTGGAPRPRRRGRGRSPTGNERESVFEKAARLAKSSLRRPNRPASTNAPAPWRCARFWTLAGWERMRPPWNIV
jgi:hypothetical protein